MRVLDLFSGLGGWSQAFRARGHDVFTVDWEPYFEADLQRDIAYVTPDQIPWQPHIILASPPCGSFSLNRVNRNFQDGKPVSYGAKESIRRIQYTLALIDHLHPQFFIIENPKAMLRTQPILAHLRRVTITQCRYGKPAMKPTDLWGGFPPSMHFHRACRPGDDCHPSSPRGSSGLGARGMNRHEAAKIPEALSLAACLAAERDLKASFKV